MGTFTFAQSLFWVILAGVVHLTQNGWQFARPACDQLVFNGSDR